MVKDGDTRIADELFSESMRSWYFSQEDIENKSPSRKDGIDLKKESELRLLYCLFIRDVGMRLKLPQVTIATAVMFCHRFYLHQSHAKNDWQTIATVCIFLASKVEDTPCGLDYVVRVAYETIYKKDPVATRRIYQKDVFQKQKALILIGERLLLTTIRFDVKVQHPYKPLFGALKKLGITQKDVRQVAWNFVNDWLRTSLCLQYKPHYIAAGSLFLAAKLHNIRLPSERGYVWWHEFDVSPQQLQAAIQQMTELLGFKRKTVFAHPLGKPIQAPSEAKQQTSGSPDSVLSRPDSLQSSSSHDLDVEARICGPVDSEKNFGSSWKDDGKHLCGDDTSGLECQPRDSENSTSTTADRRSKQHVKETSTKPDQVGDKPAKVDIVRIKELIRKRKKHREVSKHMSPVDDSSEDAWIQRALEAGIALGDESVSKKQRQ
ncbi:cyclin-T1-2-like [Typha angustifolia]|uniref:cyclin-T1-2-like n=1 Tax=Typha angustifolia TaxID=59011 RepID=UPI003C2EE1A2